MNNKNRKKVIHIHNINVEIEANRNLAEIYIRDTIVLGCKQIE